eukprot:5665368-Pleurochrysis_carterae.AAC.1
MVLRAHRPASRGPSSAAPDGPKGKKLKRARIDAATNGASEVDADAGKKIAEKKASKKQRKGADGTAN